MAPATPVSPERCSVFGDATANDNNILSAAVFLPLSVILAYADMSIVLLYDHRLYCTGRFRVYLHTGCCRCLRRDRPIPLRAGNGLP